MIVYEVRVLVDDDIRVAYRTWLDAHIAEILALPGFTGADLFGENDPSGKTCLVVRYRLRDQAALDVYLKDHAPRLRADGMQRFGTRFSASRRVHEWISGYHSPNSDQ